MTSQYDISNQNARKIIVFDTTLRDGEQSPGASMKLNEKVQVAQALVELGAKNDKVVVLDADLAAATQTKMF